MRVITGKCRGRKLEAPKGLDVRPTSDMTKEAVFSILTNRTEGAVFLDLFAGTGQMGIEALSRMAKQAIFIDSSKDSIACVKENVIKADLLKSCRIAQMDSLSFLSSCKDKIDIAFVDPPYGSDVLNKALPLLSAVMKEDGIVLVETDKRQELPLEIGNGFKLKKVYKYGLAKITSYLKEGLEEE